MVAIKKLRRFVFYLFIFIIVVFSVALITYFMNYHRLFDMPSMGFCKIRLTREILDKSLDLGTGFLMAHQRSEGNFDYEYDWISRTFNESDSQVRQAGALWGLTLIYQDDPSPRVNTAIEHALHFFETHSEVNDAGMRYIRYPGNSLGRTGTVALVALAYVDYLRVAGPYISNGTYQRYKTALDEYIAFIVNARTEEHLWHDSYRFSNGQPYGSHSPYFDGESLLALVKAYKYMDRHDLGEIILDSADAGYVHNVRDAREKNSDSGITKGYYQWGSMAFYELVTSGIPDTDIYGDYVLELADWMIDVHRTLWRTRNTAYAYEGIIHAYELAKKRQDSARIKKYGCVIDKGLTKLTSWQIGSPLANRFIRNNDTSDPLARGGIQNHRREPGLRIDVTQHQMHAVILARRYVYNN